MHGTRSSQPEAIAASTLLGFSVGMIGERVFRDAPALLLLIYMTNSLGIPPALAGAAIFVPKLLIIVIDPLVGTLSDRLRTRWGRRRPLMLVGGMLASLMLVGFFHVPLLGAAGPQALLMSLLVLVGFSFYALYSVPYLTMASEMAGSDDERRRIMSWRVVFMAIGLLISAFAGGFMQILGGGRQGYATMSWVYGGICFVTMLGTVLSTGGLVRREAQAGTAMGFGAQMRLVAGNRLYRQVLLVGFAQKLAEGVGYGSFAYFCVYVVHQSLDGIGLVVLASTAGQILAQPLWLRASRHWRAPTLYTVGTLGGCLNLLLWLAMRDQSPWWLIPLGLQAGASAGGYLMVTLGMFSNAMAAEVARTGVNREGIYSGVWLAAEKLAFALGALIVGVVIALFGFVEGHGGLAVPETRQAVFGVAVAYCGVTMVVYLASILVVRRIDPPAARSG